MHSDQILAVVDGYGAAGVFGMALMEKFIPIVPSYLMLMVFGMAAQGWAEFLLTLLLTTVASTSASLAWYGIGRWLGDARLRSAIASHGKYVFLSIDKYQRMADAYRRNAFLVSLIGQGVPVARIYLALPAGVMGVDMRAFASAALIGIAIYNLLFLGIGVLIKDSGRDPLATGLLTCAALVAAELLALALLKRRQAASD